MIYLTKNLRSFLAVSLLASALLPFAAEAARVENFELEPGTKQIIITGSCSARLVTVHIFEASSNEPFYTAGTECIDNAFRFKDNLGYWNVPEGTYRAVVYDADSTIAEPPFFEEAFGIEGEAPEETALPSPATSETSEPQPGNGDLASPEDRNESAPEADGNSSGDGILQKALGVFKDIGEAIKSALASLGLFIENGIARVTELIAAKITADDASIKNLEVSEKIQLRDHVTGDRYCTWIENGEWKKEKCGSSPSSLNDANIQPIDTNSSQQILETTTSTAADAPAALPTSDDTAVGESPSTVEPSAIEPPVIEPPAVSEVEPPVEDSVPGEVFGI